MKNPKINRMIGYIILFIGFALFYKGFHAGTAADGVNGVDPFLVIVSLIVVIGAAVWMFLTVRCPHCNCLLNPKLANIDICPQCGKRCDEKTY